MRHVFYPWHGGYNQVLPLAEALDGIVMLRRGSRYKYRATDVVVNWGSSVRPPQLEGVQGVLNPFENVGKGKVFTYQALKAAGVPTLEWTTSHVEANSWQQQGYKVVGRTRNHGMGGAGITVYQPEDALGDDKFFTKYIRKEREFRFHVFQGRIIFVQEKLKTRGEKNDPYIRSHGRGWCFAFRHFDDHPIVEREQLESLAIKACHSLGLDFGGVDLGWNGRENGVVFEVNSAPGIENSTLTAYVEAFKGIK